MARIVVKFGGTSVASVERIRQAARHVKREVDAGHQVAVVVSAMSGKTNELVGWVNESSKLYDAREYDAVVASGEQVTAGLMAVVLSEMGIPSRSFSGWHTIRRRRWSARPCRTPSRRASTGRRWRSATSSRHAQRNRRTPARGPPPGRTPRTADRRPYPYYRAKNTDSQPFKVRNAARTVVT